MYIPAVLCPATGDCGQWVSLSSMCSRPLAEAQCHHLCLSSWGEGEEGNSICKGLELASCGEG